SLRSLAAPLDGPTPLIAARLTVRPAGRERHSSVRRYAKDVRQGTEWKMRWLERVLPSIVAVTSAHPERTMNHVHPPDTASECGGAIMSVELIDDDRSDRA